MKALVFLSTLLLASFSHAADFTISLVPNQHTHEISEVNGLQSALSSKVSNVDILQYTKTADFKAPTIKRFTSVGAATYAPDPSVKWIRVRMVGGGGGASGGGASGGAGANGSVSTFGSSLLSAGGGLGSSWGGGNGGLGGSATVNLPAIAIFAVSGEKGFGNEFGPSANYSGLGGTGGASAC